MSKKALRGHCAYATTMFESIVLLNLFTNQENVWKLTTDEPQSTSSCRTSRSSRLNYAGLYHHVMLWETILFSAVVHPNPCSIL